MATCFVIQPFDRGKFDGRYKDIFKPAITKALEEYTEPYLAYSPTERGWQGVLDNEDQFVLQHPRHPHDKEPDDSPF